VPELIQFCVHTFGDHAALAQLQGRILDNGPADARTIGVTGVKAGSKIVEQRA